jgi:hypothetical protein
MQTICADAKVRAGAPATARHAVPTDRAHDWWPRHREATLNWLALGLLLAAWNASDDGAANRARPDVLRGYGAVSVRAAHRALTSMP